MSLANRLKRLEQEKPELLPDPDSLAKFMEMLRIIYGRVAGADLSEAWLAKQSNATATALALYGDLPLPECLTARLQQISGIGGPPGKLAAGILEMRHEQIERKASEA